MYINKKYLLLIIILILGMSAFIGYSYINSDLTSTSSVTINKYSCTQSNLYDRLACMSIMDNVKSKYVSSNFGIDFSSISSDTNGKGLYTYSSSLGDTYPIYFYRGAVDNNNVKFANFCWKIVRTTSTGGTKLIYNGEPDTDGKCIADNTDTEIDSVYFNSTSISDQSPTYIGYKYGNVYPTKFSSLNSGYVYGESFNFVDQDVNVSGDGTYTLQTTSTDSTDINTHHYTCLNSTGTCSTIYYIFHKSGSTYFSISLKDGKNIDTALSNINNNTTDSVIKKRIDKWFEDEMIPYFTSLSKTYDNYLEDTIWCNQRNLESEVTNVEIRNNGFIPNGGVINYPTYFNAYRIDSTPNFTFTCSKNDAFTVSDTINGNGALKYPIATITADEAKIGDYKNTESYLYTGSSYWTMTPYRVNQQASIYKIYENGITGSHVHYNNGVRPMISLNHSQVISSGDGTKNNPYVIN